MKNQVTGRARLITTAFAALLFMSHATAQNVTAPYSILGIGDVDTKDYGRYFASGSASLARRDADAYNFSNPASLTALPFKTMHFDISVRGQGSRFSYPNTDTFTFSSRDFVVKRVVIAFRPSEKTGMAFGLRPYSSVNYFYIAGQKILDGNDSYTKLTDGSGGINQIYYSAGRQFSSRLSAGITASYLFGSLQRKTNYIGNTILLNLQRTETDFYNGAQLLGGLQYYSAEAKKWRHQLGFTLMAGTRLNGTLTTEYTDNGLLFKTSEETGRQFKMPFSAALGYSAVLKNKLSISADAVYYGWPYQKLRYNGSYTNPTTRLSLGMEYAKKEKRGELLREKSYFAWGFSAENAYSWIKNKPLWGYAVSAGGGFNLARNISVYTGIEKGIRGSKTAGQIRENYTRFIAGITLKDIWLGPKFTRRYY
jgi:hypothetical protein